VTLLHNLPNARFWDVVRNSEMSVVPLRDGETNCGHITLVGSMLLGRAIVATRSDGIADYVEDGVTARLVPPGDADALAATIAGLWDDYGQRQRIADAGQAYAARVSDERHMVDYIRRYLETAGG
jgi:glycosyltransferase involved in cell wall biosynthesis